MKQIVCLLFCLIAFILAGCGTDTNSPTTPTSSDTTTLQSNSFITIIPSAAIKIGSDSTSYGTRSDERPSHTVIIDTFKMSAYEIMNHEFAMAIQFYIDSISLTSWDTLQQGLSNDTLLLFCQTIYKSTDTVYVRRGDSTRAIIKLNDVALNLTLDTTYKSIDSTYFIIIKPTLSWSQTYANYPVQGVSWFGAAFYCWIKTEKERLSHCFDIAGLLFNVISLANDGYRLPTEAEWEFAARDGKNGDSSLYPTGNFIEPSKARYLSNNPIVAGYFLPNGHGIYDLAGNVWEWCIDSYSAVFYNTTAATNPNPVNLPLSAIDYRVLRGGSYKDYPVTLRTSRRGYESPLYMEHCSGIRVVKK